MSYENITKMTTMVAGQDMSSLQYRFVSLAPDGQVDPTGLGLEAEGILQDNPSAAGRAAAIATLEGDISMCVAGGVIPVSRDIMSDANGRAIIATSGGRVQGVAMEAASAAGDIIAVMIKRSGYTLQVTTTTTTTSSTSSTTTTTTVAP